MLIPPFPPCPECARVNRAGVMNVLLPIGGSNAGAPAAWVCMDRQCRYLVGLNVQTGRINWEHQPEPAGTPTYDERGGY